MKYRKKPVVIEAMQLRWETWNDFCGFIKVGKLTDGLPQVGWFKDGKFCDEYPGAKSGEPDEIAMAIPTLEGVMIARQNDWIIKGAKGELYPCKPDVFEAVYERVEE